MQKTEDATPKTRRRCYMYQLRDSLNKMQENHSRLAEIYEWTESGIVSLAVILLFFIFAARVATVSGASMKPTLLDKDRLLLRQIGYSHPQYGEIVVIDRSDDSEPPIIKRVIGCEGDMIDIDFAGGRVYRNGELLKEPYLNEPTHISRDVQFPVTVPKGHLFVMGDNRNHSLDSRSAEIGMVDLRRVMGKASFRLFPLDRVGWIDKKEQ